MATKLRPLKTEMPTSASMIKPVMPMAIKASTNAMPEAPRRCCLVDVDLKTIAGDISSVVTIAIDGPGLPVDRNHDHSHVVAVTGGDRTIRDEDGTGVDRAGVGRGIRIVAIDKRRGNIGGIRNLVPALQPNGLGLLQQNLRGAEIFPRHLDGEETRREPGEQRGHASANDAQTH